MPRWQMEKPLLQRVNVFSFEFWGVKLSLILDVRQMVIANILISGKDYGSFLQIDSSHVLVLPSYNTEFNIGCCIPCGVTMVINRAQLLRCSLNIFPNVLEGSPMYSSSQSTLPHHKLYITPLFWWWGLCPLGPPEGLW